MNFRLQTFVGISLIAAGSLAAQGPAEAEALVKQAFEFAKTHGTYKLIKAVNTPGGPFRKGELYIWIVDLEGVMLAHGANPRMVGKDASEKQDTEAVHYAQEAIKIAEAKGSGWFSYKFTNPESKLIQTKECYVQRLDEVVIACGAYKP